MPVSRRAAAAGLAVLAAWPLAGCDGRLQTLPAPSATDPACTEVIGQLPRTLGGLQRRDVTGAGTAAWGDPAITLFCGVDPPGPTTDRCLSVGGDTLIDWVELPDPGAGAPARFVTYGRTPAIEVQVPAAIGGDQPSGLLVELAPAISAISQSRHCT